jgi:hypothetical protein
MENIEKKMECYVCFETYSSKVNLECSHELCLACFSKILQPNEPFHCPMCRKEYNTIVGKDSEKKLREEIRLCHSINNLNLEIYMNQLIKEEKLRIENRELRMNLRKVEREQRELEFEIKQRELESEIKQRELESEIKQRKLESKIKQRELDSKIKQRELESKTCCIF